MISDRTYTEFICLVLCLFAYQVTYAQVESLPSEVISYIEDLDPDTEPALIDDLVDNLVFLQDNPMNLNEANSNDLRQLQFLDELKIQSIIEYRTKNGDFLRIEELQSINNLTIRDIRLMQYFVVVNNQKLNLSSLWKNIMNESDRRLFLRYERDFPLAEGYKGEDPAFEGSPDQFYTRLRWRYGTIFSAGFTMEKDHGESFFRGSNKYGFDYASAHVYLRQPDKLVNIIAVGDYSFNLGQGLIRHSGYGGGKSSFVMSFNKSGRVIRPYGSVDENNYLRGVATELKFSDKWSLAGALSYRNRDANQITQIDTFVDSEESFVSSLQVTGLHRTENEIADEDAIQQLSAGGRVRYNGNKVSASFNVWHDQLSDSLGLSPRPDNLFRFRGKQLTNLSFDYQWRHSKFYLFGESAMSFPGGHAHIHGLMTSIHPKIDIGIVYRYLSKDYKVLSPNAFVENAATQNEQGLYLATQLSISRRWSVSAYMDIWKHPWLRFQADAPSDGQEFLAKLRYYHKRTFESYIQYRRKTRERNFSTDGKSNIITASTRESIRLHFAYNISKVWEWRSRIELSNFYEEDKITSKGFMIYQDFICKPADFPVSFTTRFALFQTDSYDSRIYAYENNVLYAYSIPAYYRDGLRSYINLRYKAFRNFTLEGRYGVSYFPNEESLSAGNQERIGSLFQGVKFQARIKF